MLYTSWNARFWAKYSSCFGKIVIGIYNCLIMKYLIKTTDSGVLETVDYTRVIWNTTDDNVLIQNTNSGGGGEIQFH